MKHRLNKLELAAQKRAERDRPIYIPDPSKYDPSALDLLALTTGRQVVLPDRIIQASTEQRIKAGWHNFNI